jgi:predicted RNase H-like nuclease
MGPLTARAAFLRHALADCYRLEDNLIEVFPRATLSVLGFQLAYKKDVDHRIDILAALPDLSFAPGVWRESCRQSDHLFDAVICGYTGYLRQRDEWTPDERVHLQSNVQGWIWVPPELPPTAA